MILFKACPRCGGDIETTYPDDAYCIQCSHRPEVAYPGPRVAQRTAQTPGSPATEDQSTTVPGLAQGAPSRQATKASTSPCPRCGSADLVRLDKLRERDNTCYRCRLCGHIFSPAERVGTHRRQATSQANIS